MTLEEMYPIGVHRTNLINRMTNLGNYIANHLQTVDFIEAINYNNLNELVNNLEKEVKDYFDNN